LRSRRAASGPTRRPHGRGSRRKARAREKYEKKQRLGAGACAARWAGCARTGNFCRPVRMLAAGAPPPYGPPRQKLVTGVRMRFEGTSGYVATDDLKVAVNAAITLERPLLVKGEPGTGKTVLALEIAKALNAPLIEWHVKSTTKALQGLYEYDAVSRLRDSQLGDTRVHDIRNYIKRGKLWDAFVSDERPVLLIDEIDKADIEFPNDLLQELDRMEFFVYETSETVKARRRPIVVITSNNEKELPDAFLRRCFFHYIRFPDNDTMRAIIDVHFPGIKQRLVAEALRLFYEIRDVPGLKKKPSTSELLDWLKLLMVEDIGPEILRERDPKKLIPPLHGALLKNEQDVHLFERLAFMARREGRS
jgi:MoxR-like ATPase